MTLVGGAFIALLLAVGGALIAFSVHVEAYSVIPLQAALLCIAILFVIYVDRAH